MALIICCPTKQVYGTNRVAAKWQWSQKAITIISIKPKRTPKIILMFLNGRRKAKYLYAA